MPFTITYHRPNPHGTILPDIFQTNEPQITEWVTPEGWSATDARTDFESRYPGCIVLRCDDIEDGNLS